MDEDRFLYSAPSVKSCPLLAFEGETLRLSLGRSSLTIPFISFEADGCANFRRLARKLVREKFATDSGLNGRGWHGDWQIAATLFSRSTESFVNVAMMLVF